MKYKYKRRKGFFSTLMDEGFSAAWKILPFPVKIKILGGIAIVILFIIIIAAILGAVPSVFLDYSNSALNSRDIKSEYEEYWDELCSDGDSNCTEEQIQIANDIKTSQEKFFNKLDSLFDKYYSSINKDDKEKMKYIVLTTAFYDYDIEEFTEGTGAFYIDDTDEINYDISSFGNIYQKEQDTLKELVKQFDVYSAVCSYSYIDIDNKTVSKSFTLKDSNNNSFILNFFDYAKYSLGFDISDKDFKSAKNDCLNNYSNSSVTIIKDANNEAALENYYKYLETTTYFDKKPHLKTYFSEYGRLNGLDTKNLESWPEEDLQNVRNEIIANIKIIVDDYMEEETDLIAYVGGNSYWWPIGSRETTTYNGNTYATGAPEFTIINSHYGTRFHPVHQEYRLHNGIDLHGLAKQTNIIASMGGTVIKIHDGCDTYNSSGCGGGYGNFVQIQDVKGNMEIYAHMAQGSIIVSVNDVVSQGQVIGKVGSSGTSTGQHLHFSIFVNGQTVDPYGYISIDNPRPTLSDSYSAAEYIFNTLIADRFTPEAAAGVLGNIYSESRFKAVSENSSSGAYGICQWLGGRKTALMNYANNNENSYSTIEVQVDFLLKIDLYNQDVFFEKYAGITVDEYKTLTDTKEAAKIYCRSFERPGTTYEEVMNYNTEQREKIALAFYNRFVNGDMSSIGDLG